MTKTEIIARVKQAAEELHYDYERVGIRVQEVPFELGEMTHCSHVWDDGEDTGVELSGVCVLDSGRAELFDRYFGDHIAIIAGNEYEYGEDDGEIILKDAVVIDILA